jgi:hypothetical protein
MRDFFFYLLQFALSNDKLKDNVAILEHQLK